MCIEKKRELDEEFSHPIGDKYEQSGHRQVFLLLFIFFLISDVTVFCNSIYAYEPAATGSVSGRFVVQNWCHRKLE